MIFTKSHPLSDVTVPANLCILYKINTEIDAPWASKQIPKDCKSLTNSNFNSTKIKVLADFISQLISQDVIHSQKLYIAYAFAR